MVSSCTSMEKRPSEAFLTISPKGEDAVKLLAGSYFLRANDALKRGEFSTAENFFEKLTELLPENSYLKTKYAISLIYTKKLAQARNILIPIFDREYRNGKEESQKIGLMLAGLHTVLKDGKSANNIYNLILKKFPKNQESCILLAKFYSSNLDAPGAHQTLSKCEKADKNNAIFSFYRGQLYLEQKKYALSHRFFDRALEINPQFEKAIIAKGGIWFEEKKFHKTMELYGKYLEEEPYSHAILSRMVQIMLILKKDGDITEYIERLSYLEPSNLNLKVKLGIMYANQERYREAIGVFKEILMLSPNSDKMFYYIGSLYKKMSRYNDSILYFSKISHASSLFYESALQIATILESIATDGADKGEEERVQQVEKFIAFVNGKGKKFEDIRVDMAMILSGYYEGQSNFSMAKNTMVKVRGEKGYGEQHDYYLASLHEKVKEYEKADKIIKNLLDKNPDNVMALNHLGYTLLERGESLDLAHKYIKRAVELQPENGYVRDSLGWYYYKKGDYKAALVEVKKAWELVSTDAVVAKHLAQIYIALKKYSLARKYYRKALEFCRYDWEKQEILQLLTELDSGSKRLPAGN